MDDTYTPKHGKFLFFKDTFVIGRLHLPNVVQFNFFLRHGKMMVSGISILLNACERLVLVPL